MYFNRVESMAEKKHYMYTRQHDEAFALFRIKLLARLHVSHVGAYRHYFYKGPAHQKSKLSLTVLKVEEKIP